MINKKNLWFLTLFSLILVLSVYYITMPSELLLTNSSNYLKNDKDKTTTASVEVEESELLAALRVSDDESVEKEMSTLKSILTNKESTVDEKNDAFDKMKKLNINKTKEKEIESKIESEHKLKSFVKIKDDQVKHDSTLANNIMRTVQNEFDQKMYITVQFKG